MLLLSSLSHFLTTKKRTARKQEIAEQLESRKNVQSAKVCITKKKKSFNFITTRVTLTLKLGRCAE